MNCHKCKSKAVKTITKYGIRLDCYFCKIWAWGYDRMVCIETHDARKNAHLVFDTLWKSRKMSRSFAYALLATEMKLSRKQCHIKLMNKEQAKLVIKAVAKIKKDRGIK